MKIRKAIIPAAGLGTRVLPATKAMPKEMLPIVDKPALQYLIEELIESGIKEILIITGRNKQAIENHFDYSYELEHLLEIKEKKEILNVVQNISKMINLFYVRQKMPLGLGDAIKCAESFVGNEPFLILLGDDIIYTDKEKNQIPVSKQLIDAYEKNGKGNYIGYQKINMEDVSKYGIIKPGRIIDENIIEIDNFIEKPNINEAPSNYAALGRYILEPEIFEFLNKETLINGEIQLTPAILNLSKSGHKLYGYEFEGIRYDTGDKFGMFKATVEFGLRHPELKNKIKEYLKNLKL